MKEINQFPTDSDKKQPFFVKRLFLNQVNIFPGPAASLNIPTKLSIYWKMSGSRKSVMQRRTIQQTITRPKVNQLVPFFSNLMSAMYFISSGM